MHPRRLTRAVLLLLGGCLLLGAEPTTAQMMSVGPMEADPTPKPTAPATKVALPRPSESGERGRVSAPSNRSLTVAAPQEGKKRIANQPETPARAENKLSPTLRADRSSPETASKATAALVSVEVSGPAQLALGQTLTQEIAVRNRGRQAVAEVHVEEALPPGARLLRSEPPAQVRGKNVTWDIGTLEASAVVRLKVEIQPAAAGDMNLRPFVAFRGEGATTRVTRPPFAIEMTANRANVLRGEKVSFHIRVSNNSETPIRKIKLYDTLPPGLQHPAGKIIGMTNFGDLLPGKSRSLNLETTAIQSGKFRNEVVAQADGGVEAKAGFEVVIGEPSLLLRVDGPKQGVTRQNLDFHLELANPGPTTAKRPRVMQTLPPSFEAVAASSGAVFDAAKHSLIWTLPDLAANQRHILTFRIQAADAGDWPLYSVVSTENLAETRLASVLHIEGAAQLKLEVRAHDRQLAVGEETTYAVHVINQGDAPCRAVRLTAILPDEVTPLEAKGPRSAQIDKQQVRFAPLEQLPPRGEAVYRLPLRGRQAGAGRVRVELTADQQPAVRREVSVQVHGGSASASAAAQTRIHDNSASTMTLR